MMVKNNIAQANFKWFPPVSIDADGCVCGRRDGHNVVNSVGLESLKTSEVVLSVLATTTASGASYISKLKHHFTSTICPLMQG